MNNEEKFMLLKQLLSENVEINNENDRDKKRAAYALNLCMVSVSQIIDYNDIYILEQEYETILNNLNLECFPKDEALLNILKQLLDTITFFRIQEGDKRFIEKEYQHEMKNAIWKAVPNIGLLVAGGSPVTMAVSLASQVGIGYMNYRNAKSKLKLDKEKKLWELQKTAIEQFNGLRRELFDTAWRLADKYKFPDDYRLTERQISQFNNILMDNDLIRKYERLTSIKESFTAYPAFWYYYGNTANMIYQSQELELSDNTRRKYKEKALMHYQEYWNSNEYPLLRENHISSACALEQIDLLNSESNKEEVYDLINKAVQYSGKSNDILQLCVFAYLKIQNIDEAEKLLRILVNEEYNTVVNAQILSFIYFNKIRNNDNVDEYNSLYETLCNRVNSHYLCVIPDDFSHVNIDAVLEDFYIEQKQIILEKYNLAIKSFIDKYYIKFAKLIPVPDNKEHLEYYYTEEGEDERQKDVKELFDSDFKKSKRDYYIDVLQGCYFVINYFDVINEMHENISAIAYDSEKLETIISNLLVANKDTINDIHKHIIAKTVNGDDINELYKLASPSFYYQYFDELRKQIMNEIQNLKSMYVIAEKDMELSEFCSKNDIAEPIIEDYISNISPNAGFKEKTFRVDILGEKQGEEIKQQHDRSIKISNIIQKYKSKINIEGYSLCIKGDEGYLDYINQSQLKMHKVAVKNAFAVLVDNNDHHHMRDLVFMENSIVPVIDYSVKRPVSYKIIVESDYKDYINHSLKYGNDKRSHAKALGQKAVPVLHKYKQVHRHHDVKELENLIKEVKPMIKEIYELA